MLDWLVEVRNPSKVRVGQFVDADLSDFTCVPRTNDVGSWEIKLPNSVIDEQGKRVPHPLCAALRQQNAGIIVTAPNGVVLSGPMIYAVSEQTPDNPDGLWTITGVSDTIELAVKLAYPDPGNSDVTTQAVANDIRTDDVEGLLRSYVSANIGPAATAARKVAGLSLAPDLNRGPVRKGSPRFQNLLELCQELAKGTTVLFDVVQQGTGLQFRILTQVNATAAVRWDIENRQLDTAKYGYGAPDLTRVIVAGQDQGTARTLIEVTTADSLAAEAVWGRRERFVDQRQTDDATELTQKGQTELADGAIVRSLDVVPSSDMAAGFMSTWYLGTLVTVTVGGQSVAVPISEVPIKITPAGLFVGAIVGDYTGFDWESVLSKGQRDVEKRVDALERNMEIPADLGLQIAAARNRNRCLNGAFRTNQRAVASGGALGARGYGHDRWRGAGIVNLDTDPRMEAAGNSWTNINATVSSKSTTQAHSGTKSMALSATSTFDSAAGKTFSGLIPGATYMASAWVFLTNAAENSLQRGLYVRNGGNTLDSNVRYDHTKLNQWQRVWIPYTLGGANTSLEVRVYSDPSAIVYIDDVMLTQGDILWPFHSGASSDAAWAGTADASISTRGPATNSYTFTPAPQGQQITLASGSGIMQIIERANLSAGVYVLSWSGTATGRVYNVGTDPAALPAFAASGMTVTLDGLDNVVVEFRAVGGSRTLANVQLEGGSLPTAFEVVPIADELAACQRYYLRETIPDLGGYYFHGWWLTAARAVLTIWKTMRAGATPVCNYSNLGSDSSAGGGSVVAVFAVLASSSAVYVDLNTTGGHPVNGVAYFRRVTAGSVAWLELDADF